MKNTIFYTLITLLFLLSCKKEKPEFEIQKSYHTFVIDGHLEECTLQMGAGNFKTECYSVTESNNTFRVAKEYLKFDTYETGYRYTVKVLREQKILNREPYQDEIYLPQYTVLEVLKKEKL
ncbi:hypothetical protein [Capnocytophaga sputigena]|uniref:hypothetical protein n=1 Tax=Capnocytophaga sputigena TaxID=1019 RepID=UPI0028D48D66|nr:hypothetical protein [Capnocytophaga sputigena]